MVLFCGPHTAAKKAGISVSDAAEVAGRAAATRAKEEGKNTDEFFHYV